MLLMLFLKLKLLCSRGHGYMPAKYGVTHGAILFGQGNARLLFDRLRLWSNLLAVNDELQRPIHVCFSAFVAFINHPVSAIKSADRPK